MPRLAIAIEVESTLWARLAQVDALIGRAAAAVAACGAEAGSIGENDEVCVVLGDDQLITQLNGRWRRKELPTNVLSFPSAFPDNGHGGRLLGDVVLAFETIEREARDGGKSLADHVAHLTIHGILHLLGHDHVEDTKAEAMEALETRILLSLGIDDPYAARAV